MIIHITILSLHLRNTVNYQRCSKSIGGIRGTMVAHWIPGQQAEGSILHEGMIHNKIHLLSPGCLRPRVAFQVQNHGLKRQSFHFISKSKVLT